MLKDTKYYHFRFIVDLEERERVTDESNDSE